MPKQRGGDQENVPQMEFTSWTEKQTKRIGGWRWSDSWEVVAKSCLHMLLETERSGAVQQQGPELGEI